MNKNLLIDVFAFSSFGGTVEQGRCVCHGYLQTRADFKDEVSWREFGLSHLCQQTQDGIFDSPTDEVSVEVDLQEAYRKNPFNE
jgi:hypothetical protein